MSKTGNPMTCEDFVPFIDAYVDQEFDERELAEMEMHLKMCPECREHVDFSYRLKQGVKSCLSESAPGELRGRIFGDLEALFEQPPVVANETAEVVELRPSNAPEEAPAQRGFSPNARWIALPIAAALAAVVVLPSFTVAPAKSGQLPIVEQTVDWHVGNYPIEVTGPDGRRVSQWFRNKVDFPVRLPQFQGSRQVNLLGGRIAHVQDRRAAYLLYEVDGTRLSVLVFDGEGLTIPSDKIRNMGGRDVAVLNNKGYEVAVLQDSGVTYTLTSELPENDFVSLVSSSVQR